MKKSLIALAALATVATAAQAQSSVTVYGVMDLGVGVTKGANAADQSATFMVNGGLSTSRWGVRGVEDLGGGLKANFNLEGGILASSGNQTSATAGQMFDRAATVGLEGGFGAIKLGRQNTIAYDTAVKFDPLGGANVGGLISLADATTVASNSGNLYNSFGVSRYSNAVQYYTPTVGGLRANVQYSIGGVAGDSSAGKQIAAGLHYAAGKFEASAIYLAAYQTTSGGTLAAGDKASEYNGYFASYDFGVVKALAGHTQTEGFGTAGAKTKVDYVGAIVPITAPLSIRAFYGRLKNEALGNTPKQYAASLQYAFSKRTTGYLNVAVANQDGTSKLNSTITSTTGYAAQAGVDSTTTAIGIRHTF